MAEPRGLYNVGNGNVDARHCPVCRTGFVDPKCLSCGHTACASCCENLRTGDYINCPVCRHATMIPNEGLPTNYVLQEMVNVRPIGVEKPYSCTVCNRPCAADEVWIGQLEERGYNQQPTLFCAKCTIHHQAVQGGGNAGAFVLVSEAIAQYNAVRNSLREEYMHSRDIQNDWRARMDDMFMQLQTCVNGIVEASTQLRMEFKRDVDAMEQEYHNLEHVIGSFMSQKFHFDSMSKAQSVIRKVKKRLEQFDKMRQRPSSRLEVALGSLNLTLDCFTRNENGEENNPTNTVQQELASRENLQQSMEGYFEPLGGAGNLLFAHPFARPAAVAMSPPLATSRDASLIHHTRSIDWGRNGPCVMPPAPSHSRGYARQHRERNTHSRVDSPMPMQPSPLVSRTYLDVPQAGPSRRYHDSRAHPGRHVQRSGDPGEAEYRPECRRIPGFRYRHGSGRNK